ncbi:BTB/POZ domain-containing protein 2-like [Paramacrobiotus metropolitanus]|uniref:BTB/POZ domain-containing protein 2-like n=1 Tax=Paramacrobiotus metropolitanus TaxID=2943436 RepID=UPI0024465B0E|nr:BTB/POZ domain-containing protein 2-like [Paramacrobiotus metropolitanus]
MKCADKYDLPLLVDRCFNLILDDLSAKVGDTNRYLLHLENALKWAVGIGNAVETCLHFVDVHSEEVFKSELFMELQPKTLQMVLERDTLFADESIIYMAVNRWAAAACTRNKMDPTPQNRRQVLGDILFLIRFPLMTVTQLVDGPLKDTLLLPSDFMDICRHKEYLMNHPLRFSTEPRRLPVICVGDWEFQHKEEVFVNEMDFWCPAVVIGARGAEVVCNTLETGKEGLVGRRPETIIRAADYLEYYDPILHGSRGFHEEATYIKMEDAQHIILVAGIKRQVQFSEILLKHTQTTAWISTMAKDNRKVHIVPMRKRRLSCAGMV